MNTLKEIILLFLCCYMFLGLASLIQNLFLKKELKQMLLKDLIPLLNDNTEIECKDQSKRKYYIFNKERYSCYSNLYKNVLDDKKVIRITPQDKDSLFILVE